MRVLRWDQLGALNEALRVEALDELGPGGANHLYAITGFDTGKNESIAESDYSPFNGTLIAFQKGPLKEAGDVNGITAESLLAIVADRLRSFQAGPFSCRENSLALTKVEEAMHWLNHQTLDRMARGVLGTNEQ